MPPAPVRVPGQRPLAQSITSVTSVADDKGDSNMIPRAVQLGDRLTKGLCLKRGSSPPNEISRMAQQVRKEEKRRRKEKEEKT